MTEQGWAAAGGRGMGWSAGRRDTEYRLIMTAVKWLCTAGAASNIVPGIDTVIGAVLVAGVLVAVGVAVVRRELQIRRSARRRRWHPYASRPPRGISRTRVGPDTATAESFDDALRDLGRG